MLDKDKLEIARRNFILASEEFCFEFESPFTLTDEIEAFGYIPNYGSRSGVIICLTSPPAFQIDHRVVSWCKKQNCFYSFLNIELLDKEYNRSYFKEMLQDWGMVYDL